METPNNTELFSQQLSLQLETLSGLIEAQKLVTPSQESIKLISELSLQWIKLANKWPLQFFASLQFYKAEFSYSVNLASNHIVWSILLCKRMQWSDVSTQYIVRCAVCLFASHQKHHNIYLRKPQNALLASLNAPPIKWIKGTAQLKQSIWNQGLSIGNLYGNAATKQLKQLGRLSPIQQISWLSAYLSLQITQVKSANRLPWSKVFRHLAQTVDPVSYTLIDGLTRTPGLVPPGSFVVTNRNQYMWIQSEHVDHYLAQPSEKSGTISGSATVKLLKQHVKQVAPVRSIPSLGQLDLLWGEDWNDQFSAETNSVTMIHQRFRLDKPPNLLQNLQNQIEAEDPDLEKICVLINKDSAYAAHLQATATLNNRRNLPIHEVKHALMYNGYYRTGCILTQRALTTRLAQDSFPAMSVCLLIIELAGSVANSLSHSRKIWMAEELHCFMTFYCSGYFLDGQFKKISLTTRRASPESKNNFSLTENVGLHAKALQLAKAWRQDSQFIKALSLLGKVTTTNQKQKSHYLAVLLELSHSLALHILLLQKAPQYNEYKTQLSQLNIEKKDFSNLLVQSMQEFSLPLI